MIRTLGGFMRIPSYNLGDQLKRAGLTKAELSRRLGLSPNTVSSWREPPQYAKAYIDLLIDFNRYAP